jgi:integrase
MHDTIAGQPKTTVAATTHGTFGNKSTRGRGAKDARALLPRMRTANGERVQHQEVLLQSLQTSLHSARVERTSRRGREMSKRGNGEGSIYRRRSDGLYIAAVTCPSGRRRVRSAHSRPDAVRKLEELKRELTAGIVEAVGNPSLRTFMQSWIHELAAGDQVRPHTLASYGYAVRWADETMGNIKLRDLSRFDIQRAIASSSGLGPSSIRTRHSGLRVALQYAMDQGLIAGNPAMRIPLPHIHRREMRTLNESELHQLLAAAEDPSWRCLWVLLSSTGLRIGEALGLRWRHVDLDRRWLQVVASLSRANGGWILHEPKSARSRRMIYLSHTVAEQLHIRRRCQNLDRLHSGSAWRNDWDLVFTSDRGTPSYTSEAGRFLKRDLDRAGLPHIRIHDLRHTAATIALHRSIHPKVVSDMLGHSSIAITLDLYSHASPAMHQELADLMDVVLGASS